MTTLALQVSSSLDDCYDTKSASGSDSAVDIRISAVSATSDGSRMAFGTRFQNVTVARGSTVSSATFEGYVISTSTDDASYDLYANDVDNAADFTSIDLWSRTLTTASVTDTASSVGVGWHSLTCTTVIQEIIDRAGWASGNAIVLMGFGKLATAKEMRFRSWNGDSTLAAKLTIVYTAPPAASTSNFSLGLSA